MFKTLVSDKGLLAQAQRLAIARLKHRVNEMETQVEYDRRLQPPIKKVFDCIVDDTALIAALQEIRRWVSKGGIEITIPIASKFPKEPSRR